MIYIIVLALIQGLTEFLPVSSSGHLVLVSKLFGNTQDFLLLSVLLHVATLFSVVFVLRKQVWEIIKNPFGNLSKKLVVATIPTVILVFLFKSFIEKAFSGIYLPFCFMATAVLIIFTEVLSKNHKNRNKKLDYKDSLIMGVFQGIAVLPGISRSGSTICGGLISGANRDEVANFSFLMSIPIIVASLIMEVYDYVVSGTVVTFAWYELLIGFVVAFISGFFAVKFMINLIKKHSLIWFSIYLILISVLSFFII